jgi:excinuclease ABC subunit C
MLKEVLERRFKHIDILPNLVLIDGGKGQLNSIKELIPKGIPILGISKGKYLKRKGMSLQNEFWYFQNNNILRVDLQSPELLVDLRDEAHRFAISHFRNESIKSSKRSLLDSIEGIGVKRRKELLRKFGDINGIEKATFEDIYSVVKNRKVVQRLKSTL